MSIWIFVSICAPHGKRDREIERLEDDLQAITVVGGPRFGRHFGQFGKASNWSFAGKQGLALTRDGRIRGYVQFLGRRVGR